MSILTKEETQSRTISKTVTYRVINTLVTFLMTLMVFDVSTALAGSVALAQIVVGSTIYYIYDRFWLLSAWARSQGFEAKKRSIVKTIGYRLIVLIAGFIVARLILTTSNETALEWTIISMLLSMVVYYIHERVWNKFNWGKNI
jgi:uncharacterized membrane protein